MQVRAKKLGFYGHRRRKEGDVFHIEDAHFSEVWMEKLGDSSAPVEVAEEPAFEPEVDEAAEGSSEDEVI